MRNANRTPTVEWDMDLYSAIPPGYHGVQLDAGDEVSIAYLNRANRAELPATRQLGYPLAAYAKDLASLFRRNIPEIATRTHISSPLIYLPGSGSPGVSPDTC